MKSTGRPTSELTETQHADTIRELETIYDRAAVALICDAGALAIDDSGSERSLPHQVTEFVGSTVEDWFEAGGYAIDGRVTPDRAMSDLLDYVYKRQKVAYLIGIAVGRRLGHRTLHTDPQRT
jgi:hypothetical protein